MNRLPLLFLLFQSLIVTAAPRLPIETPTRANDNGKRYVWSKTAGDIVITNKVFGQLHGGDSIIIPARPGGYNSFSLDRLNSGRPATELQKGQGYINIVFEPSAYMSPSKSDNIASYMDNCYGLKIYGYKAFQRTGVPWRLGNSTFGPLGGKPHGYCAYIWIDSFKLVESTGFENYYTGPYPEFAGNTLNSMHHWKFTNGIIDGTCGGKNQTSGQVGIILGRIAKDGYWLDIEIANVHFDHYYSGSGFTSGYILASNSYNVKIHDCSFKNLGMVAHPTGHAAAINYAVGKVEVYNNRFGPNNFGNDVRSKNADLPIKGYMGLSRIYNNISFNKRKYPFVEAGGIGDYANILLPYFRHRTGPEIYNNTCYNMSVGVGNDPYVTALYDCYMTDTIICYNNLFVKLRDTSWSTNQKAMFTNTLGPVKVTMASNNRFVQQWSESGLADSVYFKPIANGPLHNTGKAVPEYANKDIYGTSRPTGAGVDIGAVELSAPGPKKTTGAR